MHDEVGPTKKTLVMVGRIILSIVWCLSLKGEWRTEVQLDWILSLSMHGSLGCKQYSYSVFLNNRVLKPTLTGS